MIELLHSYWFLLFATIIITTTVTTIAAAWQKVRRTEQEAALKQDMLRRGLSAEEIERVLLARPAKKQETSTPGSDNQAIEELAECLGESQASADIIEQVMSGVQAAEPSLRQAVACAVRALIRGAAEAGVAAEDEHILAVVRGLSRRVKPTGQHEPAAPANTAIQRKPDPELEPIEPV